MYELNIETVFSAAHAILVHGQREVLHGHDWRVTASISGDHLDADGLLVDFHAVEEFLKTIVRPFRNANLNETPPFNAVNPTAEHVAAHVARSLQARLGTLPEVAARGVRVAWVRVSEAPGCTATYRFP